MIGILKTIEMFLPMKKIPTTTHQQKKVAVRNGKPVYYESEKLQEARSLFMSALYSYVPDEAMNGALRLTAKWCFPMIKGVSNGQYKTTKPDLDNLQKLLNDCMTDLGYWNDDNQIASLIVEKFWSEKVGIYIRVEELEVS